MEAETLRRLLSSDCDVFRQQLVVLAVRLRNMVWLEKQFPIMLAADSMDPFFRFISLL